MAKGVVEQGIAIADGSRNGVARGIFDRHDIGDRQRAEGSIRDRLAGHEHAVLKYGLAADDDRRDAIDRGNGEVAGLGQRRDAGRGAIGQVRLVDRALAEGNVQPGDGDGIVGAVDRDKQRCGGGIAVAVAHRVGEGFGQRVVAVETLDCGEPVVECVGIAAVGVERQRAEGACACAADGAACNRGDRAARCRAVRADAVRTRQVTIRADAGEDVAGCRNRAVFLDRIGVVGRQRRIVLDGDGQRGRDGIGAVRDAHRDLERLAVLDIGRRMIDRAQQGDRVRAGVVDDDPDHVAAVGRTGQRAGADAGPGHRYPARGKRRAGIAERNHSGFDVGIGDRDRAAEGRAVGGVGIADRIGVSALEAFLRYRRGAGADHRGIVGAIDRDRQGRGGSVTVAVADGVGEGLAQRLVVAVEPLDCGQRVIERVSVAAVGVERQRAESA